MRIYTPHKNLNVVREKEDPTKTQITKLFKPRALAVIV